MNDSLYRITKGFVLFRKSRTNYKRIAGCKSISGVKRSDMLFQTLLINGVHLFKQNNRVFVKSLQLLNSRMCRQLCPCVYSACSSGGNDNRAVPVACIIGKNKYKLRAFPFRAGAATQAA